MKTTTLDSASAMRELGVGLVHVTTVPMSLSFLRGQVGFMQDRGFKVHAVSSGGDALDQFAESEGVIPHDVPMERRITLIRDITSIARMWFLLRRLQPSIVHAHTPKGGLLGMISAWLARTPVRIYYMRGLPYMTATGRRRWLLQWTERISCRLAHRVICVSHSLRIVAIDDGISPPDKITVLCGGSGNGVDAKRRFNPSGYGETKREELRHELGVSSDAILIGFVGRLVRDKGIAELAAAWSNMHQRFPDGHLLLIGPFEPQDPVPPEVIASLEEDPRVHALGAVADPAPYYSTMDLVVLPTYREGFPNVPLEAAAMELPVVATRIPGCVDAVQDGVTGTLVPPRDANALAEAIERYLRDPELRRRHGQAGRERVLREFRQEAIWEALYGEYARLLAAKGITPSSHWNIDDSPPKSVDHQNVPR